MDLLCVGIRNINRIHFYMSFDEASSPRCRLLERNWFSRCYPNDFLIHKVEGLRHIFMRSQLYRLHYKPIKKGRKEKEKKNSNWPFIRTSCKRLTVTLKITAPKRNHLFLLRLFISTNWQSEPSYNLLFTGRHQLGFIVFRLHSSPAI